MLLFPMKDEDKKVSTQDLIIVIHKLRSVNYVTEGIAQESPMGAS